MYTAPKASIASKYVIKTHYIMRVLKFYPEDQTVDLIQDVFEFTNTPYGEMTVNNEFGNTVTVTLNKLDILHNVPVKQLRWGQFEIQACPVEGDTGYIEVFTNDIQDWLVNGGPSIPWSDKHFVKNNCVFVPFVPNAKNASQDYPVDNTKMVIKSQNASIVFSDTGAEGSEPEVSITTTAKVINVNAENGINISGDITSEGDISVKGNITVDGTIEATKDITSKTDVIAGGVSLKNHMHDVTGVATPSGTVTGTTGAPIASEGV